MISVEEVMTPNPERADVADSIREVLYKLVELDIRHLPVVDDGELIGMISDRDLRGYTMPLANDIDPVNTSDRRFDAPVSTLMNGDVISVTPQTDITEVIDLMIDHKIGAVPVIDGISGVLLGIVSYIDIIRNARDVL
ncbi:MAG: CBS domain-containing protein [Bradymonadaceae bacterium]|nr:CBS domain-containing protein [Lujinxingiaceae bacterium]